LLRGWLEIAVSHKKIVECSLGPRTLPSLTFVLMTESNRIKTHKKAKPSSKLIRFLLLRFETRKSRAEINFDFRGSGSFGIFKYIH
jgi:hypothetical protein